MDEFAYRTEQSNVLNYSGLKTAIQISVGHQMIYGIKPNKAMTIISSLFISWWLIVVASAKGFNPLHVNWDFERTGQLGDSFGVLSSAMASIAAYFAFATYRSAKDEARLAERRAAEPSFLNLLERRFDVLDRIRAKTSKQIKGQDAIEWAAKDIWEKLSIVVGDQLKKEKYHDFISKCVDGLSNYHRFVFHIISYAERQFSNIPDTMPMKKSDPSYTYVRLLRAQFSDAEMLLMAANGLYGAGNPKLKYFIERYALLNNMLEFDITRLSLYPAFKITAFGLTESDLPETLKQYWPKS